MCYNLPNLKCLQISIAHYLTLSFDLTMRPWFNFSYTDRALDQAVHEMEHELNRNDDTVRVFIYDYEASCGAYTFLPRCEGVVACIRRNIDGTCIRDSELFYDLIQETAVMLAPNPPFNP